VKWVIPFIIGISTVSLAQNVKTYIPPRAYEHFSTLSKQINETWAQMPYRAYFGALAEHESCITLTHSRCWNPKSQLKTSREEGAGIGQLTRAYRSDGSLRFDSLANVKRLDPKGLNDLRWETIYQRPDLQLRAMVLLSKENWDRLTPLVKDEYQRLAMTDAAYNGGIGGVINERRACSLKKWCDPNIWFGNVEKTCLKSTQPLYGDRSACDINRNHVSDVLLNRMPKYEGKI
jgi:hypothetical protein